MVSELLSALATLIVGGSLAAGLAAAFWKFGHLLNSGPSVSKELGLQWIDGRLEGEIDGVKVSAWSETQGSGDNQESYAFADPQVPGMPVDVHVVRDGPAERDLHLDEEEFDKAYKVDVSGVGWAWLSDERRRALRASGGSLRGGVLHGRRKNRMTADWLRTLAQTARLMVVPDPVAELLRMVTEADNHAVRAHALGALWAVAPDAVTDEQRAEYSDIPGPLGGVATAWRTGRVAKHLRLMNQTDRIVFAEIIADKKLPRVVQDVVEAAGEEARGPLWYRLCNAATPVVDPDLGAALVAGALRIGDPFAHDRVANTLLNGADAWREPLLLGVLPGVERTQFEVVEWLANEGTVAAIPGLDAILAVTWPMTDLRIRVQRARDAIQGRVRGERGALTLALVPEAGALSESTSERGAVSVTARGRVPER